MAWLTAALVLITAYYAWQNYRMAEAMNAQRREDHERFTLMAERSERTRRRKAARALLEEFRGIPLMSAGYFGEEALVDVEEVLAAIEDWSFELDDLPELQERLAVLRAICVATPALPKDGGSLTTGISEVAMWGHTIMDDLRLYIVSGEIPEWQKNMPRTPREAAQKLRDRAREERWRAEEHPLERDDFLQDNHDKAVRRWRRLRLKRDGDASEE